MSQDHHPIDRFRSPYVGPETWQYSAGVARLAVLCFAAGGAAITGAPASSSWPLQTIYGVAFISSLTYLLAMRRRRSPARSHTWVQMFVDFAVVAATVASTFGPVSNFTFLFVIVILEVGLLLGMAQGFLFATLSAGFMLMQAAGGPLSTGPLTLTVGEHWYNFLIQGLAFYLTAFISGYWSQRLYRIQQFQREILDNMNSGFLITDRNGIVTALNKAGTEILMIAEEAAVGRPVEDIVRVPGGGECPILTAHRSGRDFTSYEFTAQVASGPKLLGLTTNRVWDSERQASGIISSFTDLTEMDRLRQEMRRQDRMAVLGELAGGLAHEIRNPVAAIRGAVDELSGNLDSEKLAEKLAMIAVREADHLNEIVSGFLDFARDPIIKREPFDVAEVLREVSTLLDREFAGATNLNIQTALPDEPCFVAGDRGQIKQVFVNLGKNSIEAMGGAGNLAIALAASPGPYEIRFEDTGPGIEPDRIARIFEPFYTTKDDGVGMGLAVCLRIITAHDGTIRPESRESGGVTMTVRLPRAESE